MQVEDKIRCYKGVQQMNYPWGLILINIMIIIL